MTHLREIDFEDTMMRNRQSKDELLFHLEAAEAAGKVVSRVDPVTHVKKFYWIGDKND